MTLIYTQGTPTLRHFYWYIFKTNAKKIAFYTDLEKKHLLLNKLRLCVLCSVLLWKRWKTGKHLYSSQRLFLIRGSNLLMGNGLLTITQIVFHLSKNSYEMEKSQNVVGIPYRYTNQFPHTHSPRHKQLSHNDKFCSLEDTNGLNSNLI